ncbi:MAG: hypothetical protein R2774_06665 [Saprospiraceae bacterium]
MKYEELYTDLLIKIDDLAERVQREILDLRASANDEGTNALMSDYIRTQEKTGLDVQCISRYIKEFGFW